MRTSIINNMKYYIIEYLKILFNVILLVLSLLIVYTPIFFGCTNVLLILLWCVIVLPIVYFISGLTY